MQLHYMKSTKTILSLIFQSREHEDECTYRFVPCPNGCILNNLRQKVSNHIDSLIKNR
jgi:hypothetical protein